MNRYTAALVPGPTVVPEHLVKLYQERFYGSPDVEPEFFALYEKTCNNLSELLNVKTSEGSSVVIQSGEGMLALWSAIKSVLPWPFDFPEEFRVLCIGNGVYGDGFSDMVKQLRYPNVKVELLSFEYNEAINVEKVKEKIQRFQPNLVTAVLCDTPTGVLNSPAVEIIGKYVRENNGLYCVDFVSAGVAVPVDVNGWCIDLGLLGTQKALSCESTLSIVTVSERAWKQIEKVNYAGYDALWPWKNVVQDQLAPYTHNWPHIDALNEQLILILKDVEGEYQRHREIAEYCRERAKKMGLKLWLDGEVEYLNSPSVTALVVPEGVEWQKLDSIIKARGVALGGSYGKGANVIFRIGHMGSQATLENVKLGMDILEEELQKLTN
ncbi:serine-pyruvate aminotransferase [Basidiobolus meristosporus CBS 931.73]|uniref:alanine--glyoxylate transaminase n=1 Tax=Basidiobolus meristosporus CBS 931.73 TaxID=1314790 RepID=A0A1Y1WXI3_9FUNG|nr:serine-pyruvate aminotransferase [Basidiobolus meristosporus CBS 931.73]|eukprot:ORX77834.1 serine-pyruvate aminotransferase [Basidiobolus meristosporus CBS 931.73]